MPRRNHPKKRKTTRYPIDEPNRNHPKKKKGAIREQNAEPHRGTYQTTDQEEYEYGF